MRWDKDDDGSLVSTPIYLTMSPAVVDLMEQCKHQFEPWPEAPVPEPEEQFKDCKTVGERCKCGALRFRVTGPDDQINELFRL